MWENPHAPRMSRPGPNDDAIVGFCAGYSAADLANIDASALTLPFGKPRGRAAPVQLAAPAPPPAPPVRPRPGRGEHDPKEAGLKEITIDVRARCDPRPPPSESQLQLEIPALLVPGGYALFALALGLANLLHPTSASGVCVLSSPAPMACLAIHALGVPTTVGVGLLVCAWFVPFVCSFWRLPLCLIFFVCLGVLVGAGTRRVAVSACLLLLLLSMPLAFNPQWTGLESRWGVTLSGFFLATECVLASFGSGRVVYRIKQTAAT